MKKKHLFFAALFGAALAFGFVGCDNPDDLLSNGDDSSITDNDSTTDGSEQDGNTKPTTPEAPTLVATGGASDVKYSTVTLWGRINTDTLWVFPNIKWGIECTTSKEAICSHSGNKKLCTTDLVGENSDEYIVAFTGIDGGKMLYYNAYLLINDMKYIYGEVDSVHLDVQLTVNSNNSNYGTVMGSGIYDYEAEATITATPNSGAYFVKWNDGNTDNPRTVTINEDITYTATFAGNPNGTENGYEWVDLGLPSGLKWATCNVGADSPEDYGSYYAWGETTPRSIYSWSSYKWCNGSYDTMTKYCTDSDYGTVDNKTTLDPEDDAAAVNMGGSWRMPTSAEQDELLTECTWTWTTLNGVNGCNVEGPNGNSIFLPAAGCRYGPGLDDRGSYGYYWSSSLRTYYSYGAYDLYFSSDDVDWYGNADRYYGLSVRGVTIPKLH